MNQKGTDYKLILATDLIVYLMYLMTGDKDNREEVIKETLNNWSSRLEFQRNMAEKKLALEASKENVDLPIDVAEILISAHNIEKTMLKGEFKSYIRKLIIDSINAAKMKDNLNKTLDQAVKKEQ